MAHDHHGHHHGHAHGPAPADFTRAFALGVGLNLALVAAQIIGGLMAHSLALVAEAGHNFTDVLGLLLAWWAQRLERTAPTRTRTYGLRGASILAALTNAVLLLVTMGALGWESIVRLREPAVVHGGLVIAIAAASIVVNLVSAWPFLAGRKKDINIRAAFAHLATDAAISFGVVLAGVAILLTGQAWIDPVVSLVIVGVVIFGTRSLLKDSMNLALQAVPPDVDLRAIHDHLARVPGVGNVHDLHVWAMSTTQTALTVHLVVKPGARHAEVLAAAGEGLKRDFHIAHATIQIEEPASEPLALHRRAF